MNAVKLEDIAKKLGLSTSTVSRALSGNGRVGEKTRHRVLEAVRESDYTVNAVARSLRLRDAKNIGIVVPDITNSFFSSVIKGAQDACRQHGYTLMVCNSDESEEFEEESLRTLLEKQVSGLILATVSARPEGVVPYRRLSIPVVFIDNIPEGAEALDVVSIDNHRAASRITKEMVARGYRDVGMIAGPKSQSTGLLRYTGFLEALRAEGISPREEWVLAGDFKMESGRALMRKLLKLPERPRAMVISNNYMAYGAINAIRDAGLDIPGDIAIASFDAMDSTGLITPLIASINQPAEEIGLRAAEIIVARLSGDCREAGTEVILEPTVSEGDSW